MLWQRKQNKQTVNPKPVTQLERLLALACPPTMHDTKPDQLNKARVKGYSKYCQGQAHAKLLNQHVFKPYIWRSHCKAPRSSNNTAHRCSTCKERLCQKCQTNRPESFSLTYKGVQHRHFSSELHKEIFVQAIKTKSKLAADLQHSEHLIPA